MKIEKDHKPETYKDIVFLFVKNLIMINFDCRDKMIHEYLNQMPKQLTFRLERQKVNDFDALFDEGETEDKNTFTFNPLDLTMVVFMCSSPSLKQILAAKLFTCQLAVPFVYPPSKNSSMTISLWPLRSVIIENKTNISASSMSVDIPCHVVSFIRIGRPSVSKSKIVNEVLTDQYHNTFFNKDCPLGTSSRRFSDGMIEASWRLPSNDCSFVSEVTMFLNLRAGGECHAEQVKLLSQISTMVVVLLDVETLDNSKMLKILLNLHNSNGKILLAVDAYKCSQSLAKQMVHKYLERNVVKNSNTQISILSVNGQVKSISVIKDTMRKCISDVIKDTHPKSLSERLEISYFRKDEDINPYKNGRHEAECLLECIPETSSFMKEQAVPLQGKLWRSWSEKLKNVEKSSQYKTLQEKGKIKAEMKLERKRQLELCENLRVLMKLFLRTLANLLSSGDDCTVFVLWLKLFLDERSRHILPGFLSKYQCDWQAVKSARDKKEFTEVKRLRDALDQSEYNLAEASFGFEHLCREMGQIFEAITECGTSNKELLQLKDDLPRIAAELLIKGQTFEIMDGDAANVPLIWVKEVLQRLKNIIGDKKILALTVLGIQSSGKSTLLNTMFGLQFAVSAGRCTRGVFIQLVPAAKTGYNFLFDYVLVIDTEGLRAPELANQKYSHDNELATFVIGLGDITIVNVKGENTAEVKDVLQIAVHAFLRLKLANERLNLKQSCLFAHQNVPASDASDKMMHGRQKFVEVLDAMTKEAADQENIADIHSFNQVIDFDCEQNVWYFSDLWRGDPPMAPANPGYSETVSSVKDAIMFRLSLKRNTFLTITDTISRIEDLWTGILKDDFVFSFRNSLELKAYNSMERECQNLSWNVEKFVFEFIRVEARSKLLNCTKTEDLEKSIPLILKQLGGEVDKQVQSLTDKLEAYVDKNSLKDVMIQWKQSKRNRFALLAEELIMKGKIDIQNIKEEIRIKKLQLSEKTNHEMEINELAQNLALQMRGKIPSEEILKAKFDTIWVSWTNKLCLTDIGDVISIKDQIESMLCEKFPSDAAFMRKIEENHEELTFNTKRPLRGTITSDWISEKDHLSIHTYIGLKNKESKDKCKELTVDLVNAIFTTIDTKLSEYKSSEFRFNLSYVTEILNIVYKGIEDHNCRRSKDLKFNLLPTFRALVVTHVVRYTIVFFTELNNDYQKKYSPKAQIEEYKGTAWGLFQNVLQSKTDDVIVLGFFLDAIIKSEKNHTENLLPIDAQENIIMLFPNGKYGLTKEILIHLANAEDFDTLKAYIQDPSGFAEKWILDLTNNKMFSVEQENLSTYAKLANTRISAVFSQLSKSIVSATEESTIEYDSLSNWIDRLVKDNNKGKGMPLSKDVFVHVESRTCSNLSNFKTMLLKELEEMESDVLGTFKKTSAANVVWKQNPVSQIMSRLWGCSELCMFCGEPCMNTDKNHVTDGHPHKCLQHRPEGIGGFRWTRTQKLAVEFCNHSVSSEETYKISSQKKEGKYKDYKRHFPEWDIPPNSDVSKYWMWVMCKYQKNLADLYSAKLPDLPVNWKSYTKKDAIDSL